MPDTPVDDTYRAFREAVRRRVCAICLDGADDGSCGLTDLPSCALEEHLARVVEAILEVRARHEETYAAAIESKVCSHCSHRDALGLCRLRRDGRCAVSLFLPLIVEAVDEVRPGREGRPA